VAWPGRHADHHARRQGHRGRPWLTANPKTPAGFKQLSALGKVDLILVTHAHGDHLGDAPDLAS
jgi:phosphoribosyl 1,2-cyclic phosphodiesterase